MSNSVPASASPKLSVIKELIELEVLHNLYQDEQISKVLRELSREERQKLIADIKAQPDYQEALSEALKLF